MFVETVKLGGILLSCLVMAVGWRADVHDYDPNEMDSPLFDNDQFSNRNAVVGKHGRSLDIESTLNEWAKPSEKVTDSKPCTVGGLREWTLTYQTDPVVSASADDGEVEGEGASCSVQSGDTNVCSIANPGDNPPGYYTDCSTADAGEPDGDGDTDGTETCSVYVPPEGGDPQNNTGCSATTPGGEGNPGNNGCSAGGTTGSESCSTSGGQNNEGEADGAAVCSAYGDEGADPTCSAYGDEEEGATCSTFEGQHQSCSAGYTDEPGDSASCSTEGEPDGSGSGGQDPSGSDSFCSSNAGNEEGEKSNICSAISHGNPAPGNGAGGTADCSTLDGGEGMCSVQAGEDGDTSGQACTAIGQNGGEAPDGFECSTRPDLDPADRPEDPMCSVVVDGEVVEEPDENGQCGDDGAFDPVPPTPDD